MSSGLCKNLEGATVSDKGIEFKNPQKPLDERLYKEIKETNIKGAWRCEIGGNWSGTGWARLATPQDAVAAIACVQVFTSYNMVGPMTSKCQQNNSIRIQVELDVIQLIMSAPSDDVDM